MRMRDLEQRTGVDREVIRIYFRKGLLPEPRRRARNSAEYDEAHVLAIQTIRELQLASRMTLEEIRQVLAGKALASRQEASTYQHLEQLLTHRFGIDNSPLISLEEMQDQFPEAARDAAAFARMGIISLVNGNEGPGLTLTDARLVEIWAHIREAGFVEEAGFPPDNIGFYLTAANEVAANEASIFFRGSAGHINEEQAVTMLQKALPLMLDFFGLLRLKAFIRAVHQQLADEPPTRGREAGHSGSL